MSGFFDEVKRRKVYRVAVAYIIVAGGIIQLASAAFPAWELPSWSLRLVITMLLIGFPIALVLAWAFDITPEGIKTTPTLSPRPQLRRNVLMLIAAGVVISAAAGFFILPRAIAHKVDKSIAVLPFSSLSDDKENAYFADGIQDDILTNLSRISDIKVISRTSVMQYRGQTPNVREIGKALGVGTLLEGSVRRVGNKVRVNVQLIDATNDEHIWANDYDRDLTDVFAIQTELARAIANQLQARLSPTEKSQIERKPTENGEAYLAFMQGMNVFHNAVEDFEKLRQAEQMFARATDLDPNFALAWARYSQLESWIIHFIERTPERREKARTMAQRALELQPDMPEGHLALGFSYYYGDNDYDAALSEFQIAQRGLPNDAEAYLALGAIQRRQGKWTESTGNLEKAASLNPNDVWMLQNLALNYQMLRNFEAANKAVDRGLQIKPDGFGLWEIKVKLAMSERGDLSIGEKALEMANTTKMSNEEKLKTAAAREDLLLLQRKYQEVLEFANQMPDQVFTGVHGSLAIKYFVIGLAQKGLHNGNAARVAFLKTKNLWQELLKQKSDDADLRVQFARLLAWLGEKDAALAEAKRATELRPESKDAFEGPQITEQVAQVYTILGDNGRAIDLLEGLLNRPSPVTVPILKLNPAWDPLRNDPRFQQLLNKYGAKT